MTGWARRMGYRESYERYSITVSHVEICDLQSGAVILSACLAFWREGQTPLATNMKNLIYLEKLVPIKRAR